MRKLFDAVKESAPTPVLEALVYPQYEPADPDPLQGLDEARQGLHVSRAGRGSEPPASKSLASGSRQHGTVDVPPPASDVLPAALPPASESPPAGADDVGQPLESTAAAPE